MAQAGMHALVGMAAKNVTGNKEWLLLGVMLGSLVPDMDNLGVAVATLTKMPIAPGADGIHRTLTHSIFFMLLVAGVFYAVGAMRKQPRWGNLGLGLAAGMLAHALLDVLIWFNGVALFWPIPFWINLWTNTEPAAWFMKFMDPAEFLFFGVYLWMLGRWAREFDTDGDFLGTHRVWFWLEAALFVVFTPLAFTMTKGFLTIYGAFYLFSLFMAFFVTIRMRKTVEAAL